jgi:hypothetical protein
MTKAPHCWQHFEPALTAPAVYLHRFGIVRSARLLRRVEVAQEDTISAKSQGKLPQPPSTDS